MSNQNPVSPRPPKASRRPTGAWAVIAVLLAIGILLPLLVGLYDSETPTLWGFPFYYWFQFLLIPLVSLLTFLAFRVSLRATREDRPRFGLPPEPEAPRHAGDRR
jgi:CBS domain containing-hemolysin-like protein